MKRNLPPLNALRVFEVAARTESFSRAADILFVTQSAVSKQIRILEDHLSASLFERHVGGVRLTDAGRDFLVVVAQSLDMLENGAQQFYSDKKQEVLKVDIIPSLSTLWMFPRLEQFQEKYPEIALHIDSSDGPVEWTQKAIEAAIRCLPRHRKHADAELLFAETLTLIASPELMSSQPIRSIQDLANHYLLPHNTRPNLWPDFFEQFDLGVPDKISGVGCEHFHMTIQAARMNLGIGLVPRFFCEPLLRDKQLVNPLDLTIDSAYGYYLISPQYKRDEAKVRKFRKWIRAELQP